MQLVHQPSFLMICSERREFLKKEFNQLSFLYAGLLSDGLPASLCQWKQASFVRAYNRYDKAIDQCINCRRILKQTREARKNG